MKNKTFCILAGSLFSLGSASSDAALTITIKSDASGFAVLGVSATGSTISTDAGDWDTAGLGEFDNLSGGKPFIGPTSIFQGNPGLDYDDSDNNFTTPGHSITAGGQTLILDRFSFDSDSGIDNDELGLYFGDGTVGTPWDTTGSGVGAITVNTNAFLPITVRATGDPILFAGNFANGTYTTPPSDPDNDFWGGITLVIDGPAAIPEPSSMGILALLLITGFTARRR